MEYTFYILNFWATCACPEKQRVPWIYCTEYIFFIIQEFWVTCACPEKRSCPGIFHCIEYTLYIQEFWATSACPERQSCPEIFRCMEYTFYKQINYSRSSGGFLLLADVSPTYSSGLPQGNVFQPRMTCNLLITRNNEQYDIQRFRCSSSVLVNRVYRIYNVPWNLHAISFCGTCITSTN